MTSSRDAAPRVTVIMRAHEAEQVIGQALAALFSQSFTDFELLVVDSGSRDLTLEVVRGYPCRVLPIAPGSYVPGRVLNMAARAARGEILVFLNCDTVPLGPTALAKLLQALDEPGVVAAFARQIARPDALAWVRRDYAVSFPAAGAAPPWMILSLPFAAMRRSALQQRPFHEVPYASEDTAWGAWALAQGMRIVYVPAAVVMHSHNYGLRELYHRRFIEGEADAYIYGGAGGAGRAAIRFLRSCGADLEHHGRARAWSELFLMPLRRAIYHGAHLAGWRHGARQRRAALHG